MRVFFAKKSGDWLLAGGLNIGAIVATILAIVAAFPAKKGNRFAATGLATAGIVVGISGTLVFGHTVIVGDHQYFLARDGASATDCNRIGNFGSVVSNQEVAL